MTVKEMIEKLAKFPQDYKVSAWIEAEVLEDFEYPITGIYACREDSKVVDLMIE